MIALLLALLALHFMPSMGAAPPQQVQTTDVGLPWAYGFATPAAAPAPAAAAPVEPAEDPETLRHLPDSTAAFNLKQINNPFGPADWYPSDHPPMPEIVAHGRKPNVFACAWCHYPNGKGHPNNAGLTGLPHAYIVQQLEDFKSGARHSWDKRKTTTNLMIAAANGLTEEDEKAVAEYYASMKWTPWIKVVETDTVPKTYCVGGGGQCFPVRGVGAGTEAIGQRIVEVPENLDVAVLRDPRSGFIAYVPVGSIKRGKFLVTTGGADKTIQCGICHGSDLKGLGNIPPLAGRSPSSMARQLYDIQKGTRIGIGDQLMQKPVANLRPEDIIAITAYLASLAP